MSKNKLLKAWLSFEHSFIGALTSHDLIDVCGCNGCRLFRLIAATKEAVNGQGTNHSGSTRK